MTRQEILNEIRDTKQRLAECITIKRSLIEQDNLTFALIALYESLESLDNRLLAA